MNIGNWFRIMCLSLLSLFFVIAAGCDGQPQVAVGERHSHSAVSRVESALAAIELFAEHNIFITVDEKGALAQAAKLDRQHEQGQVSGPLHGMLIAVKDNIHIAGVANTAGTPSLKGMIPTVDAEVVARLKAAGAIILGKSNMHELAYGITSNNAYFGAVGNITDKEYIAGGSSGGSAVAVAAGITNASLGTDTGGSVRIPAALNRLVGFRPTTERYPSDGLTLISQTRDTLGAIARTVGEVSLLDAVLSGQTLYGQTADLIGLRLGVPKAYFYDNLEPAIAEQMSALLTALERAGVDLVYEDIGRVAELNERVGLPIVLYETGKLLDAYLKAHLPDVSMATLVEAVVSPDVKAIMQSVLRGDITYAIYADALNKHRPLLQKAYRDYFNKHHVEAIIFPTTPLTSRPIKGSMDAVELNGQQVPTFASYIRNTDPSSNAGVPGLSLPLGTTDKGFHFGFEIDGPKNTDLRLLAIAAAIEKLDIGSE